MLRREDDCVHDGEDDGREEGRIGLEFVLLFIVMAAISFQLSCR